MVNDSIELSRINYRGKYFNDFSFLLTGALFPNKEMLYRNALYRARFKQLTGEDTKELNYIYTIAGEEFEIPIEPIGENFFKLTLNKVLDIIFNNEWTTRTGNLKTGKQLNKLIEKTGVKNSLRQVLSNALTFGCSGIKVHKNGISAIIPTYVFKVVDKSDCEKVLGTVLYDVIKEYDSIAGTERITHVRFEIHLDGWIFDIVYRCESAYPYIKIGDSVDYTFYYGDSSRVIPKGGKWYKTGVEDSSLLKILSINKNCDAVYGESIFVDIQDNVYGLQQRITIANAVLNNLTQPLLFVGSSMFKPDEKTGKLELKVQGGKYLVYSDLRNTAPPQSFQQDYKLDNNEKMINIFMDLIYIMAEVGRPYMCGEYGGGNISTESMNNLMKPAIDKGNRYLTEAYYDIRDAIYCLAILNNINVKKEDITILFNIGRTEDDTKIAELLNKLIPNKQLISAKYALEKYMGLDEDQADEMFKQIELENGLDMKNNIHDEQHLNENVENNNDFVESEKLDKNKEKQEDKQNEVE